MHSYTVESSHFRPIMFEMLKYIFLREVCLDTLHVSCKCNL
jgi:hypothetical protein